MQTPSPTSPNEFPFVSLSPTNNVSEEVPQPSTSGMQGQLGKWQASKATTSHAHITAPVEASPQHPLSEKSVSPVAGTSGIKKQPLGETQPFITCTGSLLSPITEAKIMAALKGVISEALTQESMVKEAKLNELLQFEPVTDDERDSAITTAINAKHSAQQAVNDYQLAEEIARALEAEEQKDTTSSEDESQQAQMQSEENDQLTTANTKNINDKPYKCDACGKGFSQKNSLRVHNRLHTGTKLYPCNTCSSVFTTKQGLERHKISHTSEKVFSCPVCSKKYSHYRNMMTHHKYHNAPTKPKKTFTCNVCGKAFTLQSSLTRHAQVHSEERPLVSNCCGATFKRRDCLAKHQKNCRRSIS